MNPDEIFLRKKNIKNFRCRPGSDFCNHIRMHQNAQINLFVEKKTI